MAERPSRLIAAHLRASSLCKDAFIHQGALFGRRGFYVATRLARGDGIARAGSTPVIDEQKSKVDAFYLTNAIPICAFSSTVERRRSRRRLGRKTRSMLPSTRSLFSEGTWNPEDVNDGQSTRTLVTPAMLEVMSDFKSGTERLSMGDPLPVEQGGSPIAVREDPWERFGLGNKVAPAPLTSPASSSPFSLKRINTQNVVDRYHHQNKCIPVLTPKDKFFNFWDPIIIVCLIFTAVVTPVEVAFLRQPEWPFDSLWYVNRVVDGWFVLDMFVQFNLAFKVNKHTDTYVTDRGLIAKQYLRGFFMIDLLSILPYDSLPGSVSDLKALRMLRLLKLMKLLRVLRAGRIFKRLESNVVVHYGVMKLWSFLFLVIFSAHLMACALRLVTGIEDNPDANWILNYYGDERYAKYDDPPWATLYLLAYYWSIMTMTTIGYGDVLPVTVGEMICTVICMMIGTSIYAYIFGNVCSILDGMTLRSQLFYNTMDQLNTFMELEDLPEPLRQRLRDFYRYKHSHQGLEDWRSLVAEMSPVLQGEVAMKINGSWLQSIRLLRGIDEKLSTQISLAMGTTHYCALEKVIDLHEPPETMYIVERGIVAGLARVYTTGKCIGDDCLWMAVDSPRPYCATTLSYASLLTLQRSDIMEAVAFYPQVQERLIKAGTRARAQQKVLVYARAIIHFRSAMQEYSWSNPKTGEVIRGSILLPKPGMVEAMNYVMNSPPEKELYRVEPLFLPALEGIVSACWAKWQKYHDSAAKIQSCYRGGKERVNMLLAHATVLKAVRTLQRGVRAWLFRNRFKSSKKFREALGSKDDPNADIRIRLLHMEDKLDSLADEVNLMNRRTRSDAQLMMTLIADIHGSMRHDSQAKRQVIRQQTMKNTVGSRTARRGFKGV